MLSQLATRCIIPSRQPYFRSGRQTFLGLAFATIANDTQRLRRFHGTHCQPGHSAGIKRSFPQPLMPSAKDATSRAAGSQLSKSQDVCYAEWWEKGLSALGMYDWRTCNLSLGILLPTCDYDRNYGVICRRRRVEIKGFWSFHAAETLWQIELEPFCNNERKLLRARPARVNSRNSLENARKLTKTSRQVDEWNSQTAWIRGRRPERLKYFRDDYLYQRKYLLAAICKKLKTHNS